MALGNEALAGAIRRGPEPGASYGGPAGTRPGFVRLGARAEQCLYNIAHSLTSSPLYGSCSGESLRVPLIDRQRRCERRFTPIARARRINAFTSRRSRIASALRPPRFQAFLFPFGGPGDLPPCSLQRPRAREPRVGPLREIQHHRRRSRSRSRACATIAASLAGSHAGSGVPDRSGCMSDASSRGLTAGAMRLRD
jgi:hypothetical protein